jgi:hypothetical protein
MFHEIFKTKHQSLPLTVPFIFKMDWIAVWNKRFALFSDTSAAKPISSRVSSVGLDSLTYTYFHDPTVGCCNSFVFVTRLAL